jgi:PAS domain S-box-containing protein
MKDENKTKEQLIDELREMQQQVAKLEKTETRRKQIEEALKESKERYKRLFKSVTDYVYTVKVEDGRPVSTTHGVACLKVTGYTAKEYQSDPTLWYRIIHEADRGLVVEQVKRILAGKPSSTVEHQIIHKDGSIRWISNTPVPHYDENGRLISYDGIITDITKRKQIEGEREKLILELKDALSNIRTLRGLLPICASCKKIRNDEGYWEQIEIYVRDHSEADFSHGICPECVKKLYPDFYKKKINYPVASYRVLKTKER